MQMRIENAGLLCSKGFSGRWLGNQSYNNAGLKEAVVGFAVSVTLVLESNPDIDHA